MIIELVIARFQEDLSWIKELPDIFSKIIIYNKGNPIEIEIPKSEIHMLPNLGRDTHSYLYHVITNYNSLADITIFSLGSAWSTEGKKIQLLETIRILYHTYKSVICFTVQRDPDIIKEIYNFKIDEYKITNEENFKYNPDTKLDLCEDRPLGKWFCKHFPNETLSCIFYLSIFAASKEDIHKRPIEFYKIFVDKLAIQKNPEVSHYFERVWKNVFSIDDSCCF